MEDCGISKLNERIDEVAEDLNIKDFFKRKGSYLLVKK